ncbi:MAG TPA: TonB-dependent receptor [Steroidobacteraceae bacterium]|nr:TonB-dependent receptor [Steroidobacteraceae bacterium]
MGTLSTVPRGWPAVVLLLGTLAVGFAAPEARAGGSARHFDIPAESVGTALDDFARQADVTLLFSSTLVGGLKTSGVQGDFTVTQALGRLLGGTGLGFRQVSASAIAIVESASGEETGGNPAEQAAGAASGTAPSAPAAAASSPGSEPGMLRRIARFLTRARRVLAGERHGVRSQAALRGTQYSSIQEVVVTGTPEVSGVRVLDASFPVSAASLTQIHLALPSSSADLLKFVPGIWAESSGGETGANIEVAGFPGGNDAPYVTYQIDGSPVYPSPTLSFMDNSSLFRLDDTLQRVEVVQGGPSVVYSNGQIGATANFILRHGTPSPHGDLALTLGDEGLYRLDGFYGGPLAGDWLVSIGGFYRLSDGIRNSQFPADEGGQLTATLFRPLEDGALLFWARELHDKNLFITDLPVAVSADGRTVSAFPGFDPLTGTFAGNATRGITVEEFPCNIPGCVPGTVRADLADGRGSDLRLFGSDLNLTFGPWTMSNRMSYTAGDMPTNALFNNFAPESLGSFMAGEIAASNANPAVMAATGGAPFTSASATWVAGAGAVGEGTQVASLGFWIVQKSIEAFTDDLRFSRTLFEHNSATLGGYFAGYSSNDTWYIGNNELMTATPNAQLIDVALHTAAGPAGPAGPVGEVTQNGILSGATFALIDRYDGRNAAVFVSDQWRIGRWLLDAEYRVENENIDGAVEVDSTLDLDANPLTLYNNGTSVANGGWSPSTYDHTLGSWSAGANYEIDSRMSLYARLNEGVHFPGFDELRNGTPERQQIENYQVGYKAQTSFIYASIDAFHRLFFGVPFQAFLGNGTQVTANYGTNAWGIDFQADWFPLEHLSLGVTGDWQHSVYTHFSSFAGLAGSGAFDNDGNILQRQPRLQLRFTPEYTLPMSWGALRLFATVSHIDLRYSDTENTQVLPPYTTLDAGVVADIGAHLQARVQGTNLTDALGLTEGNSRTLTSGISTGLEMARPIFGREVQGQIKYLF